MHDNHQLHGTTSFWKRESLSYVVVWLSSSLLAKNMPSHIPIFSSTIVFSNRKKERDATKAWIKEWEV